MNFSERQKVQDCSEFQPLFGRFSNQMSKMKNKQKFCLKKLISKRKSRKGFLKMFLLFHQIKSVSPLLFSSPFSLYKRECLDNLIFKKKKKNLKKCTNDSDFINI